MMLFLPRMTPPADRPEALAPAPGQTAQRMRPSAETLVERLRKMQGWS